MTHVAIDEVTRADAATDPAVKLTVCHLTAWFGDKRVLSDVTADIGAHQVTAVIGPSGCGKSTFLRCLNRMHELIAGARLEGRVLLDGNDIYDHEIDPVLLRRRVGMVFQKPNPFPSMSVAQNVLAGLRLTNQLRRNHATEICEQALTQAALWDEVKDRLDEPGLSLSGGQQQRLCIARTLAVNPDVILMDEPCSALDPIATARIEELIKTLCANYTIVIVTHNLSQAARVSHKTAFFLGGELVELGDTQVMFRAPQDVRTQDYIKGKFG